VSPADAAGLEAFLDEYSDLTGGALLLYGGAETFPLTRRVLAGAVVAGVLMSVALDERTEELRRGNMRALAARSRVRLT
jgi:hypothetical protein